MRVICPKCQFENQAEAAQVVCARCATLIEAASAAGASGDWTDELPQRVTKPMAGVGQGGHKRDAYATRVEPEPEDEVLDIPRISNGVYPIAESGAVFDEVLSTGQAPAQKTAAPQARQEDRNAAIQDDDDPLSLPDVSAKAYEQAAAASTSLADDLWASEAAQSDSDDWSQFPAQDYEQSSASKQQDWPILPEDSWNSDGEDAEASAAASQGGRRLWLQGLLAFLVFGVLAASVWYFFGERLLRGNEVAASLNGKQPAADSAAPANSSADAAPAAAASATEKEKAADTPAAATPQPPDKSGQETKAERTPIQPMVENKVEPKGHSVSPDEGSLTLQVGSYKSQSEAEQRAASLRAAGISDVRVVRADIPGRGTWYRVHLERFTSRETASRRASTLKASGSIRDFMVIGYQN